MPINRSGVLYVSENTLNNFRIELNRRKCKYLYAKSFVKKLYRDSVLIGFVKTFGIMKFIFLGKKAKKVESIKLNRGLFIFNDPYSHYENYDSVKEKLYKESKIIDNTLAGNLFLINNLILDEIVKI